MAFPDPPSGQDVSQAFFDMARNFSPLLVVLGGVLLWTWESVRGFVTRRQFDSHEERIGALEIQAAKVQTKIDIVADQTKQILEIVTRRQ